jgi:ribosome maturation factor RimP
MTLKEQIEELVTPYIEEQGAYLIEVQITSTRLTQKVLVLVDHDEGIGIDACASISRQLAARLEEQELISQAYILEVSSPGLDQPLKLHRQYVKNIGRELKVQLVTGEVLVGKLEEVKADSLVLQLPPPKKKKDREAMDEAQLRPEIPLQSVAKAFVQVSFQ